MRFEIRPPSMIRSEVSIIAIRNVISPNLLTDATMSSPKRFEYSFCTCTKKRIELFLLPGRQSKANRLRGLQDSVKFVELFTQVLKILVKRFFIVGKDIEPFQTHIHIIEDETAEQAVFSIGNE